MTAFRGSSRKEIQGFSDPVLTHNAVRFGRRGERSDGRRELSGVALSAS